MINYRNQYGCHDCANIFKRYEYDENDTYYCTLNAPERPLCGSVAMDEKFISHLPYSEEHMKEISKKSHKFYEDWDNWSRDREVEPWGICEAYVKNSFKTCKIESIEND